MKYFGLIKFVNVCGGTFRVMDKIFNLFIPSMCNPLKIRNSILLNFPERCNLDYPLNESFLRGFDYKKR